MRKKNRRSITMSLGSSNWIRGAISAITMVFLLLSLYYLSYRPYVAAKMFMDAYGAPPKPLVERLSLAQESFDTFPPLASMPRRYLFQRLHTFGEAFSLEERQQTANFIIWEADRGMKDDPQNARLLAAALPLLQAVSFSQEELERLEPLLQRLKELAPQRVYTYQSLADQELRKGNYREAIQIAEAFEDLAPDTERQFESIKRVAEEGLKVQGGRRGEGSSP